MSTAAVLQQQQGRAASPAPNGHPWMYWSAETIAAILGSPVENVRSQWPLIWDYLDLMGFSDRPTLTAVLANIGVEDALFWPIKEAYYLGELEPAESYRKTLWYYPWFGRGIWQISTQPNYAAYGPKLSEVLGFPIDLIANPDLALEPDVSAAFIAVYCRDHRYPNGYGIPEAARAGDWYSCRVLVNGGTNGMAEYLSFVQQLEEVS